MKQIISECKELEHTPGYYIHPTGRLFKVQEITQWDNQSGYLYAKISGGRKIVSIHREVASAFISNPCGHKTVDHIDNNRKNNDVSNLQWMSREDNTRKAFEDTRQLVSPEGKIFTMNNVNKFAREHGLDPSSISKLKRGKLYSHKGWRVKQSVSQ